MDLSIVVLAAGQGTRMQSDRPKVLHEVAGLPLFAHAIRSAAPLDPARIVLVAGHGADAVEAAARDIDETIVTVRQEDRLGTAHAVLQARDALADAGGVTAVLYGDTPFIRPDTLTRMADALSGNAVAVLGFGARDPGRYGRLVMDGDELLRIVEFKDATDQERRISLCNSGVVMAPTDLLFDLCAAVGNDNAAGEYYLTDIVALARARGLTATAVICDEDETLGVNSRADLAAAEATFQAAARAALMEDGVTMTAPDTVYLSHDTHVGRDALIEPNVVFGPGVTVETGATIRAFSHLEGCHVSSGAVVGPFARLRPGAELAEDVRVGNFVEVKNAVVAEGAKINHLTYVGDAEVGARANLGAGTVTCNYDGVSKHRTVIGEGAFIGSSTMLVAPVTVGAGAMTASGSVITKDVPDGALAIGRARQETKPGHAARLMDMLRRRKAGAAKE